MYPLSMDYGDFAVQHIDDVVETFYVFEVLEQLASFRQQSTYCGVQRLQDKSETKRQNKQIIHSQFESNYYAIKKCFRRFLRTSE